MSPRVARWKAAWERRDVATIVALYADDATHASGVVAQVWPELGRTTLSGRAELAEYFRRALARFAWLRFEVVTVTEDAARAAVEYRRHSDRDGDRPKHVVELLEWDGDRLRAVRVFHA
jgi:ketosteroid isomerase-like protein